MKKEILFGIFILFSLTIFAQKNITISGFVYDNTSGQVLIGAIIDNKNTSQISTTNEYGFYSLSVPKKMDTVVISVSYVGYKEFRTKIKLKRNKQVDFYLSPGIEISEVRVNSHKDNYILENDEIGVEHLKIKDIRLLPNLFGEVDIIKAFQLTTGVQSGAEAKSNLYVRGGSPDQNLILLDDVPLYYVAHFGNFFSIFNSDVVNDVKLIKGDFPARYGGRLSSVLDVRMKDGNMRKTIVTGTIGLLSSKISLQQPIIRNKLSLLISVRKNILPVFRIMGAGLDYSFYDFNAKIKYRISKKNNLFFSVYNGNDIVQERNNDSEISFKNMIKWGNFLYAIRWNHIYGDRLFSNFTLAKTDYNYQKKMNFDSNYKNFKDKIHSDILTGIKDYIFKTDFTFLMNKNFIFRLGTNSIFHHFIPNNEYYFQENMDTTINKEKTNTINAFENAVYIENKVKLKKILANIGLRYSSYFVQEKYFSYLTPRILINFMLRKDLSFKYSYSEAYQFVHLLSFSGTGIPSDYWMPATKFAIPEHAVQNTLDFVKFFHNGKFELDFELYYKFIRNIITFKNGMSLIGNFDNWENIIEKSGKAYDYGLEFSLMKKYGKNTGWISFSISKSQRQFMNINNGEIYPYRYNRLINTNIVYIRKINKNIEFSATWSYGSGYPITLINEHYFVNGTEVFVYGKRNSFKMRDFHRLDIAVNFNKQKKWGNRTWSFSIFNLYNRQNPYYYYYDKRILESRIINVANGKKIEIIKDKLRLYQRSLFPFLPTFSYSFKF
jgi:hypothetical protein